MLSTSPSLRLKTTLLLAFLITSCLVTLGFRSAQAADDPLIPEIPRQDLPIINDGRVSSVAQIGNLAVIGGTFTSITLRDGTVIPQAKLVAFDLDTGELASGFMHTLDGDVDVVRAAEDGSAVFIGGTFKKIDGQWHIRVARLNPDGSVAAGFNASASAQVLALQEHAGRLFLGGSFESVNNIPRSRLAAIDALTGALDADFDLPLTSPAGPGGSGSVKSLDLNVDGRTLLVAHNSLYVAGESRTGVALIDIATNSVLPWQTDWYLQSRLNCAGARLAIRDAEFSPDGSRFVVVEKGGGRCDKSIAWPTADGPGLEENLWVTQMFDSVLAVGAADNAFYVGGHFCYVRAMGAIPFTRVLEDPGVAKPTACSNKVVDVGDIKARYQIAALDPNTGAPLDWNPTTTSVIGSYDIEITPRGMLHGMDGDRVAWINTGRFSFHDLGTPTPPAPPLDTPPVVSIEAPASDATVSGRFRISGMAFDDVAMSHVELAVRNRDTKQWVQPDLSLGQWTLLSTALTDHTWESSDLSLPNGRYKIHVRAIDQAGNTSDGWVTRNIIVSN